MIKKLYLTLLLTIFISSVSADVEIIKQSNAGFTAIYRTDKYSEDFQTAFFAIPEDADVEISMTILEFDDPYSFVIPQNIEEIHSRKIGNMRNIPFSMLYMPSWVVNNNGELERVKSVQVEVSFDRPFCESTEFVESAIYDDVIDNMFINHITIPRRLSNYAGSYISLTPEIFWTRSNPL